MLPGRTLRIIGGLVVLWTLVEMPANAATLPSGFTEELVAGGIASPTAMQFAPDGRLFVCEQQGRLRVIKNDVLLTAPFLTLSVSSSGERGLLGVAFDPNFAMNHYVYVYYTATAPAVHNRISRFTANGDVAVAGSELVVLDLDNLSSATNHNGGALGFGADGKLYAAVGENGNSANAQSMTTVLGKILRINSDGTIPTDNPFFASTSGKNRAIWALGLRNPFTFAFHPFTGALFINDVGEGTWEEIDDGIAGSNYGWPTTEGPTTDPRFRAPRYAYNHNSGVCAITGSTLYAPSTSQFPSDYVNDYFFADYCGGWIKKLDLASNTVMTFATGIQAPVDLKVGDDGSLYYLARDAGAVYRVRFGASAPTITAHPANQSVAPGASVTFSVRASGVGPLRYQWQRNSVNITGATAQDYTLASVSVADNGARFAAVVSNDYGNVLSNAAVLTVTSNQAPTGTITQPAVGMLYTGGAVINYAGTGTDPEDGTLPATAFTWWVDFHHDTHTHPFMAPTTGSKSGAFTIPTVGETSANVWYRVYLSVKDGGGLTHTSQRDIFPRKVRLSLATNPSTLSLLLDGQPVTAPLTIDAVVGMSRTIEAPTPQTVGATAYNFASWSDGGARLHGISTPATDTTYTAAYQPGGPASPTPIVHVQHAGIDAGSTTSGALAFPSANTAGNWIGVAIRAAGVNQVLAVTDTNGNVYQRAAQFNVTLDAVTTAIFYAEGIKGGSNTVRVTTNVAGTLRFAILEYTGVATSNSLDVTAGAQGSSTAPNSGPLVTTSAGELLLNLVMTASGGTVAAGSGFTIRQAVPVNPSAKLAVEDQIQSTAGTASGTATLSAGDTWGALFAAFRPASGGSAPGSPVALSPGDGASGVSTSASLNWSAVNATSYDIRFGTASAPPMVATGATAPTYTPLVLAELTTYYWQITARNATGMVTGPVWSFTTAAPAPPAPIALIQQGSVDAGTQASATLAFTSANTAGNFIAVAVRAAGGSQVITITDSRGNQYRRASQFNVTQDNASLALYYAENVAGGANTVRVTLGQSATLRFSILEYAGVAKSNALDGTAAAQGSSTSPNSGSATTTANGDLLIGVIMTADSANIIAGSGYTRRTTVPSPTSAKLAVEDRLQATAGQTAATASFGSSGTWGAIVAAFKAGQ